MLKMAIVDGARPGSRRLRPGLQPTKTDVSGLRPTHSTFHRASRCHAGYEVVVMVLVNDFRVGADRRVRPRVSNCLRIPKPKGNSCTGRHGSLPLQDLIRDLTTDDLDQQNLRIGAGRCAYPSNETSTRRRGQAWKPAPTGPQP